MKIRNIACTAALLLATMSATRASVLTIADWSFENNAIGYVTNPVPVLVLTTASAFDLGMGIYPTTAIGTNLPDVLLGVTGDTGGNGVANLTQTWRVRSGGKNANGWSSAAPIGSQGAEFNVSTIGFTGPINVAFDWYATTQGEGRFQLQYTTDGWVTSNNIAITIPVAEQTSLENSNNFPSTDANTVAGAYVSDNALVSPGLGGQDWYTNLSASITDPAAANNANFGIRIVNASTGAACVNTAGAALNNNSGNWRYDNIIFSGTAPTGPTLVAESDTTADSNSFAITFAATPAWSSKITSITASCTAGSYTLPLNSSTTNSTTFTFNMADPAAGHFFRTNASVTILVTATGYAADSVVQLIAPGVPTTWNITRQPTGPTGNGGTLVVSPAVSAQDQWGNTATTASGTVTATPAGGIWSFGPGSGSTVVLVNGSGTFTNLSAISAAAVSAADITFSSGSLPTLNTVTFAIPAPLTSGFAPTNLAVFQEDVMAKNSTFSILEVNPANNSLVHTYPVSATGTNALRTSSAATTGRMSDSGDGTCVCFTGFLTQDGSLASTPDVTFVNPRAAATFDAGGNLTLQTSYIGDGTVSQNQTRSATSIDNRTWWIGDKGGVFTNNTSAPVITVAGNNVRSMKTFGGTVYFLQQASGKVVQTPVSLINPSTLTPVTLAGFTSESNDLDFYMVQSGQNGNSYDILYYIDGTAADSSGNGGIFKYYFTGTYNIAGSPVWSEAGSSPAVAANLSGDGLCARTNATGGIDLFFTTGTGGIANNSLILVHDSGATNTLTLGTPTTIYTAVANSTLKGVAFAPVPAAFNLGTSNLVVGPAAGSNSVVLGVTPITALNAWTASTNATWLHLSTNNQTGFGGTNVIFTYDANPGATRSSTIIIAGQTLNITQAGSTYVFVNPLTSVVSATPVSVAVDKAGNVYAGNFVASIGAVAEWSVANNTVTPLVTSSMVPGIDPVGVAVDGAGNVYIADSGNDAVEEWSASSHTVTTLVSGSGVSSSVQVFGFQPYGVAVDGAGNVYIADNGNQALEEWIPANPTVVNTLIASGYGLSSAYGVAVDAAGNNVYIADETGAAVYEWSMPNTTLTTLVNSSQVAGIEPNAVAVDGAGNVYIADAGNSAFEKWRAADQTVTTPVSGIIPGGVAADGVANVYIGNGTTGAIDEIPRAFVDPTAKSETGSPGSDTLPVVLPATENLGAPFVPTSSQIWLTVTSTNNGIVTFGFTANAGPGSRSANIGLLGQTIAVSQSVGLSVITPLNITPGSMAVTGSGTSAVASFSFTNAAGLSFSVHATNVLTAATPWPVVSTVTDSGGGHYNFTDPHPATNAVLFYYLSQP